jgi:hypothetical protein
MVICNLEDIPFRGFSNLRMDRAREHDSSFVRSASYNSSYLVVSFDSSKFKVPLDMKLSV